MYFLLIRLIPNSYKKIILFIICYFLQPKIQKNKKWLGLLMVHVSVIAPFSVLLVL
jgi:hypothetical protein